MSDLQELKPADVQLGNFFDSMGNVEIITELILQGEGSWFIGHKAWGKKSNPMGDGIQYSAYPLPLTDEWKVCLGIDKHPLPEWIKYVHEAQNYFRWALGVNLLESMNWNLLPKKAQP